MTFSTRNNPRIAQSGTALTSLGAVGGPRGTAAGALRILVEFLTTYNKGEIGELQGDLRQLEFAQANSVKAEEKRQTRLTQVKNNLAESERIIRGKLNTQLRSDLKEIEVLEQSRSKTNRTQAAQQRVIFEQAAKSLGLSKEEIQLIADRRSLLKEQEVLVERNARAEEGQIQRNKQIAQTQGVLGKIEAGRASLLPKLGGLAIGALGGLVGGALLGVGFQIAQDALAAIGDKIQDLIDPTRHVKDEITSLGQAVAQLASDKNISFFAAATAKLEEWGVATDDNTVKTLASFAAQEKANASIQDYIKYLDTLKNPQAVHNQTVEDLTNKLIELAKAQGNLKTVTVAAPGFVPDPNFKGIIPTIEQIDRLYYYNEAVRKVTDNEREQASAANALAQANQILAQNTALAKVEQENLNAAVEATVASHTSVIDARIASLGTGESARTRRIQAAIDAAQGAGSGSSNRDTLRNIAEQRQLILLRQRLRLLGQNIDLEKYSGKFLLEAIDAKTAAIEKQGQAQAELNKELDLQYRMSQQLKRQSGESINQFLERRAQEGRAQLQEQADIDRQKKLDNLAALKARVQDTVALQDLENQRLAALRQQSTQNNLKNLQKQLADSKKHDAEVLASKKKALQATETALQTAAKNAETLSTAEANLEITNAAKAANTIDKLAQLSGKTRGLEAARSFLQGLLLAGLPPDQAKAVQDGINRITATLNVISNQLFNVESRRIVRPGQAPYAFAKGGVFALNNGSTPFGQNAKFGEHGPEIGVVLSNRVTQALKENAANTGQVGPFIINESNDIYRDRYMFKQAVKEAMAEALG